MRPDLQAMCSAFLVILVNSEMMHFLCCSMSKMMHKQRFEHPKMMRNLFRRYSKMMHSLLIWSKFSEVEERANARKYGDSIMWFADANLVHLCRNVNEPYLP